MFSTEDKVLVAVSGGKDSLALWDILLELGFNAWGLHLNLGLGKYAEKSQKAVETFAQTHQADLILIDLKNEYGWGILDISSRTMRTPCSACGLLKRYLFNGAPRASPWYLNIPSFAKASAFADRKSASVD